MKARLAAGRQRNDASIPGEGNTFLTFLESLQTCPRVLLAPRWMGTGAYFPAGKVAGVWSWPLSAGLRMRGKTSSLSHMT